MSSFAVLIMPSSRISSSGLMPRASIRSASAVMMSGLLTDGPSLKLSEPVVRLARSGLASPSKLEDRRPLLEFAVPPSACRRTRRSAAAAPCGCR